MYFRCRRPRVDARLLRRAGFVLALAACGDDPTATPPAADASLDAADATPGDTNAGDVPSDAPEGGDAEPDVAPGDDADAIPDAADADLDAEPEDADGGEDAVPPPPPELISLDEALAAVDVFTGTGGTGFAYASLTPAVQHPVGYVKYGPDTTNAGFHPGVTHFSGYNWDTPHLRGFSHTHLVGTGAPDYGNLRFLPARTWNEEEPWTTWTARDRDTERGEPGLYEVRLPDEALSVRLSAGTFSGILEVTPEGDAPLAMLFDAAATVTDTGILDSEVVWDDDGFEAWVDFKGPFVGRRRAFVFYLSARYEPAPDRWEPWGDAGDEQRTGGEVAGLIAHWDTPPERIVLRTGLSVVDAAGARANREREVDGRTVDEVAAEARAAWEAIFEGVRIAPLDAEQAEQFYSALYNAYRMPSRWSEADGRYLAFDGELHEAEGFTYYTDMSIWDTFRTLHPWYELTNPELTRDVARSLLDMAARGDGRVPRWPAAAGDTGSMIGSCGEIVLAGAAAKRIEGVDWEAAFDVAYASSFRPLTEPEQRGRDGVERYVELGWVPSDEFNESASKTLEYAWADDVLHRWALRHGRTEEAELLEQAALSFERVFNPETRFFAPRRADGTFDGTGNERSVYMRSGPFTEGNAWHWRFYALQRIERLAEMFGGEAELVSAIEESFARSNLRREGPIREVLPPVYYWHGNEPSIHNAAMFTALGARDRAVHWSREIAYRLYGTGPDGLPGNDDGGTMSAWWLFTALGLYPIAGTDAYLWTWPLVPEAEVRTGSTTRLRIEAPGAAREAPTGEIRLFVDGVEHTDPELRHDQIVNAVLRFEVVE